MGVPLNHPFQGDFPLQTLHSGYTPIYGNPHVPTSQTEVGTVRVQAAQVAAGAWRLHIQDLAVGDAPLRLGGPN